MAKETTKKLNKELVEEVETVEEVKATKTKKAEEPETKKDDENEEKKGLKSKIVESKPVQFIIRNKTKILVIGSAVAAGAVVHWIDKQSEEYDVIDVDNLEDYEKVLDSWTSNEDHQISENQEPAPEVLIEDTTEVVEPENIESEITENVEI